MAVTLGMCDDPSCVGRGEIVALLRASALGFYWGQGAGGEKGVSFGLFSSNLKCRCDNAPLCRKSFCRES